MPDDGRGAFAIVNGIGYDNWASQLLAANPVGNQSCSTSVICSG